MTSGVTPATVRFALLLRGLDEPATAAETERAALLLTDFLHCHAAGATRSGAGRPAPWAPGPVDVAAVAAQRSHVTDADDLHHATLVHPGSVVWPVVLALGATTGASGRELAASALAGYEATVRLAAALGAEHRARFHTTATAGTVGAAAATAVLLDLPERQWADAMGHAISVLGGSAGCLAERSGSRVFHRAHAVRAGVAAALAAADGLDGTRGDLDRGGGAVVALDAAARATLLAGGRDALLRTSLRLFPTSGWNQPAYEAALMAGRAAGHAVRSVVVRVPASVAAASQAAGPDERWLRLEWAVATALTEAAGEPRGDPEALTPLVRVVAEPDRAGGALVEVTSTADGARAAVDQPMGHPDRELSHEVLAAKWSMDVPATVRALAVVADELRRPAPGAVARLAPESVFAALTRRTEEAL